MKKLHFNQFAAIIFALIVGLASCSKEDENPSSSSASIGTATIYGSVVIDSISDGFNEDGTERKRAVPFSAIEGARVYTIVDNNNLVDGDYEGKGPKQQLIETTVNAEGKFVLTLPASTTAYTPTVTIEEHRSNGYIFSEKGVAGIGTVIKGSKKYPEVEYEYVDTVNDVSEFE